MSSIVTEHFNTALRALLDETFDNVQGFYLDRGTSLFETLATISATEASIPVGGRCATLAAQVKHIAFYLDVLEKSVRDPNYPRVDWGAIWRTVGGVTPEAWGDIQAELRTNYNLVLQLINDMPTWPSADEIGGAMAIIAHTAYHLGEIRQALCILRPATTAAANRSMPEATIIPELAYSDVLAAAAWLCDVFGFEERLRIGKHRVQLSLGTGSLVVTQQQGDSGAASSPTHAMMVRVANVDEHYEHARQKGANVLSAPTDYVYGERQYSVADSCGRVWTFSQTIADVDPAIWGGQSVSAVSSL